MHAIDAIYIIPGVEITTFTLKVLRKGNFNTVFGSISYADDEIRIDNPYLRERYIGRFSEYDEIDGMNLEEFIVHKCNEMFEGRDPMY